LVDKVLLVTTKPSPAVASSAGTSSFQPRPSVGSDETIDLVS
jgi:hypothetical protein